MNSIGDSILAVFQPEMRWRSHFYDPKDGKGLHMGAVVFGEPSLQWGKDSSDNEWDWNSARIDYYRALTSSDPNERNKNFAFVFRGLGQVVHLVHDLAVPSHVRNDPHNAPALGMQYDLYENIITA